MKRLHLVDAKPNPVLALALQAFESEFRYPLGNDRWFRISHGVDYTRFFRAIGEARSFVEVQDGTVNGVISVAHCPLRMPSGEIIHAAYIADLKVRDSCRGRTVLRLLREAVGWARRTPNTPGFSIVMDGTAQRPSSYTGRLGIPAYAELAKVLILRIPCTGVCDDDQSVETSLPSVRECFQTLTCNSIAALGGDASLRSEFTPIGLVHRDQQACGIIENTLQCKRLYADDGSEMLSGHLSCFGYRSIDDAVSLLKSATVRCHGIGMPALFVSLPADDGNAVLQQLSIDGIVTAPATIFGVGLPTSLRWFVNTSEI